MIVKKTNRITLKYQMTDSEGQILDQFTEQSPLIFTVGDGEILPKLEEKLLGKSEAEDFRFKLSSRDAYGDWEDGLSLELEKDSISTEIELEVGMALQTTIDDELETIWVTEIGDRIIVADMNHPFAGLDLFFTGQILSIEKTT